MRLVSFSLQLCWGGGPLAILLFVLPVGDLQGQEKLSLPGPGLDVAVDVDGDGVDSFGDRYFFNWWLEQGGSLDKALGSAKSNGSVIDITDFLAGPDAQLPREPSLSPSAGAAGAAAATNVCPPPGDLPNHTRRIPPNIQPTGADSLHPRITPNGRFIVFSSAASNLPGANGFRQIYRMEQSTSSSTAIIEHISKKTDNTSSADSDCNMPSISNDGKRIVFETRANLDPAEQTMGSASRWTSTCAT